MLNEGSPRFRKEVFIRRKVSFPTSILGLSTVTLRFRFERQVPSSALQPVSKRTCSKRQTRRHKDIYRTTKLLTCQLLVTWYTVKAFSFRIPANSRIEISSEICFVPNFFLSKTNELHGYERMLKRLHLSDPSVVIF